MRKVQLAIVLQGNMNRGGVASTARFIVETAKQTNNFDISLIFLATAYNDPLSTRLTRPQTWLKRLMIKETSWDGIKGYAIGAYMSEFELRRYMPRSELTELLNQYDLIQVVSGSPAVAYVTRDVKRPVCLQAATLINLERTSVLRKASVLRKMYDFVNMPLLARIEKLALQSVDHVFADTAYTERAFASYISKDVISVDTIGVNTTRFQPIAQDARSDDYILSTGRLNDPRKNVRLLFRAYAQFLRQIPDAPRLILAGMSGPSESDWALADELGIRDHIEFHCAVPPEQLVALYQHAACFVLSSNEEGLGIVLLEAMACATPVISTRCGGPDSVVSEDVGFLTPVDDAEAMADRMVWMLQNPEKRRQMGEAGRKMIESRFSYEVVGQKYLDVYDRLLNKRHE